jgi:hypothetical protein
MRTLVWKNAMKDQTTNTNTISYSNLVTSEIFSDNYSREGVKLLSQNQQKLQSQNRFKITKDNNEKQR